MTKDYVLIKKYGGIMINAWRVKQISYDIEKLS